MSFEPAIDVKNLSKRYRRGAASAKADGFRDVIASACGRALRGQWKRDRSSEEFWALRNISLKVDRGEIVAIIGSNGAGKSTLLKILSRITAPTEGRAVIHGRLASLLEVGTGFHPELTGRENVFLNGAILGMSRAEIIRKLDEIVDWSGVASFVDTPVKRYSSGMRMRLAFAVAAHLDHDILIADEVLAVGDAEFQRKCFGKMSQIASDGRTVLFVSHNMNAVLNLCDRGVVLEDGRILFDGETRDAVASYVRSMPVAAEGFVDVSQTRTRPAGMRPIITGVGLRLSKSRDHVTRVRTGDDVVVDVRYDCGDEMVDVVQVVISTTSEQAIFTLGTHLSVEAPQGLQGRGTISCHVDHLPLNVGEYHISVMMTNRIPWHEVDCVDGALRFEVTEDDYFGTGLRPGSEQGPIAYRSRWRLAPT